MRYLLALPLKPEESEEFIKLRDKYKETAPRWKVTLGPHITLFRPSEFKASSEEAIAIFKKAPTFKIFSEIFDGFEAFLNHSNNAVYSEPKEYKRFKELRNLYLDTANKIMSDTTEVWPFHPHLTLVNRLDPEPAKKLLVDLKSIGFEKSYVFDSVVLYKKESSDENWVEIARNKLE